MFELRILDIEKSDDDYQKRVQATLIAIMFMYLLYAILHVFYSWGVNLKDGVEIQVVMRDSGTPAPAQNPPQPNPTPAEQRAADIKDIQVDVEGEQRESPPVIPAPGVPQSPNLEQTDIHKKKSLTKWVSTHFYRNMFFFTLTAGCAMIIGCNAIIPIFAWIVFVLKVLQLIGLYMVKPKICFIAHGAVVVINIVNLVVAMSEAKS